MCLFQNKQFQNKLSEMHTETKCNLYQPSQLTRDFSSNGRKISNHAFHLVKVSKSRKQIMTFFGRIDDALICFWDLVTFSFG